MVGAAFQAWAFQWDAFQMMTGGSGGGSGWGANFKVWSGTAWV